MLDKIKQSLVLGQKSPSFEDIAAHAQSASEFPSGDA